MGIKLLVLITILLGCMFFQFYLTGLKHSAVVHHFSNFVPSQLDKSPKMKIVGFSDIGFAPVAKRWYDRLTSLGYTEHVIVAVDNAALEEFERWNYRVNAYFTHVIRGAKKMPWTRNLWYRRIQYCMEQIENGTSIKLRI